MSQSNALTAPRPSLFTRILLALPLVGRFVGDAGKSDEAFIFALFNLIMLWVAAGFIWGIAGVLAVALGLAAVALSLVCALFLSGGKIS